MNNIKAAIKASEHQLQHSLITWWAFKHKSYGLPEFALYACPNGGARNAVTGAMLKREGVRAGVPDLFLAVPTKTHAGLYIEMKAVKGAVRKEQQAFIDYANNANYKAIICYDWVTASVAIHDYLIKSEES